jgi:hypothetical protein
MLEIEWNACQDPRHMLDFLVGKVSERKLRLFACACCRAIWQLLFQHERRAIDVAEQFADGVANEGQRKDAFEALLAAGGATCVSPLVYSINFPSLGLLAALLAIKTDAETIYCGGTGRCFDGACRSTDGIYRAVGVSRYAAEAAGFGVGAKRPASGHLGRIWSAVKRGIHRLKDGCIGFSDDLDVKKARREWQRQWRQQAGFLRDLWGPELFRSNLPIDPSCLNRTVTQLADAIYQERAFARLPILADALEDAGCRQHEILSHCRQSGNHVRGCWVLDSIAGNEGIASAATPRTPTANRASFGLATR